MALTKEQLVNEISRLRSVIKKKYSEIRDKTIESERALEMQYRPLIEPLKEIAKQTQNYPLKDIKKEEPESAEEPSDEEWESESQRSFVIDEVSRFIKANNIDDLLAKYLRFLYTDNKQQSDFTYGVYYDDGYKMGRSDLIFNNNDIIIGNTRYKGTPGLFELIFKRNPSSVFTKEDLDTYKNMLDQTQAHVGDDGKVKSNRGYKYVNIISNMFPPKKRPRLVEQIFSPRAEEPAKRKKVGGGLWKKVNNSEIEYIYWEDPNELCERLRYLVASKQVGNNSHDNEIINILEELEEANIIEDMNDEITGSGVFSNLVGKVGEVAGTLLNKGIDALPMELHLPGGYRYCGPGTKLDERLARGDPGINSLDNACKAHDIAYSKYKDNEHRRRADQILANNAWDRVKSSDASLGERAAAWTVTTAMNAKTKLGGGGPYRKGRGLYLKPYARKDI